MQREQTYFTLPRLIAWMLALALLLLLFLGYGQQHGRVYTNAVFVHVQETGKEI